MVAKEDDKQLKRTLAGRHISLTDCLLQISAQIDEDLVNSDPIMVKINER